MTLQVQNNILDIGWFGSEQMVLIGCISSYYFKLVPLSDNRTKKMCKWEQLHWQFNRTVSLIVCKWAQRTGEDNSYRTEASWHKVECKCKALMSAVYSISSCFIYILSFTYSPYVVQPSTNIWPLLVFLHVAKQQSSGQWAHLYKWLTSAV